jgi:hypothetical protein
MTTALVTAGSMVIGGASALANNPSLTNITAVSGNAYGESVNIKVFGVIPVTSGPLPTVTLPSSGSAPLTNTLLSITVPNVLSAGVMNVSTQGTLGPSGSSQSSAETANAVVNGLLSASVLRSSCKSGTNGSTGSASAVNLAIAGNPVINGALTPNTTIPVPGIGKVILDEQIVSNSATSSSIDVNTVHVVLNGSPATGDIIISHSHCDVTGTAAAPTSNVFVGYADNWNSSQSFFPSPWQGSPNTTFVGRAELSTGGACTTNNCYDAGGVRVDNTSTAAETVHVTVDIGSHHYDLWGDRTVPPGGTLILTQTSSNGSYNFDGSDTQSGCTNSGQIPLVHVAVNGVTTDLHDSGQVLDTGGIDKSMCPSGTNEGHDWAQLTS